MIRIRFDKEGKTAGIPDAIRPGDNLTFELSSEDEDIDDNGACELTLGLETPALVTKGTWTLGFSTSSATMKAEDVSAYAIHTALNRMDSVVSAGGVEVTGKNGIFVVSFAAVGSRSAITVSHSSLGTLSGRCRTITAGGVSAKAIFELDLTVQTLAKSTTATDISGATVTVANVATGNGSTAQRNTITISRRPDRGKMQIWTSADIATVWIPADASGYVVQSALDDVEPDAFVVERQEKGESIIFDIRRAEVGANASPTVANTFIGPEGVTMSLELALVRSLLNAIGSRPAQARLTFRFDDETKFSELVELSPLFWEHGQVI